MSVEPINQKLFPPKPTPNEELCQCEDLQPLKLMQALSFNPIHCVKCNLEVHPNRLDLTCEAVDAIASWNSLYQAAYLLWLDSGDYEIWASKVLSDLGSAINRDGRDAAAELNKLRRCYYWVFQGLTEKPPEHQCATCGGNLVEVQGCRPRQAVCEQCSLIFGFAESSI